MAGKHAAPKRRKREVEDDEFAKMTGRILRAMGRRAQQNPDALAYLLDLQDLIKQEITMAGYMLTSKTYGSRYTLGDLSRFFGYNGRNMSRQAAAQRWGETSVAVREARAAGERGVAEIINISRDRVRDASEKVWGTSVVEFKRDAI